MSKLGKVALIPKKPTQTIRQKIPPSTLPNERPIAMGISLAPVYMLGNHVQEVPHPERLFKGIIRHGGHSQCF